MPRELSPLEQKVRSWFGVNKVVLFAMICLMTFTLLYIKKNFIIDEIAAFRFMDMNELLAFDLKAGVQLITIPIVYAWKFTLISFAIWVGSFLWGYRVTYKQCWVIVMIAEMIFFVPETIKVLWFLFVDNDPNYWDVQSFYPLSYMNFFFHEEVAAKYWYPNMSVNLFEILYWVILTYGVDFVARKKKKIANYIILTSYVPLFILWLWFYIAVYK